MRIISLAIILMLVSSTAYTEEVELEFLIRPSSLQVRIERFLKKHKVKHSLYYTQLIIDHPMPDWQKLDIAAMIVPESRGKANAVSPKGATGILQVMPAWKKKLGIRGSLKNPKVNLDAAVRVYNIHAEYARHNRYNTLRDYSGRTPGYPEKVMRLARSI